MPVLFILLTFTSLAFGDVNRFAFKGLNLSYASPEGRGTVEKISLGVSLAPTAYEVLVQKTQNAFEVTSDFVDVSWVDPWSFFWNLEAATIKNASLSVGGKTHTVESEHLLLRPEKRGEYRLQNLQGSCEGGATGELKVRLLEDCRTKMDASIKRADVPLDFLLYKAIEGIDPGGDPFDLPADDFKLTLRDGKYSMVFYTRYIFYAGLRSYGAVHYEGDYQTMVIRVDQIKFGYLTVTSLVMNRLKELIKSPHIKIEPPFIRVELGKNNENVSH